MNDIIVVCIRECQHTHTNALGVPATKMDLKADISWALPSARQAQRTRTTAIPHYIIILSLTFVPPAASCYKGVCHFMLAFWMGFFSVRFGLFACSVPRSVFERQEREKKTCDTSKSGTNQRNQSVLFFFCFGRFCLVCSHLWAWLAECMCWECGCADSFDSHFIAYDFFLSFLVRFGCWIAARSMEWLWYLDGWFVGWVCCFFRCTSFSACRQTTHLSSQQATQAHTHTLSGRKKNRSVESQSSSF